MIKKIDIEIEKLQSMLENKEYIDNFDKEDNPIILNIKVGTQKYALSPYWAEDEGIKEAGVEILHYIEEKVCNCICRVKKENMTDKNIKMFIYALKPYWK